MDGAQWFVRTLRDRGVDRVFVLCGNGLNPFLDACLDFDMKVIDTRNEQAASYMADVWGRFTGRLGVAVVSSGPGHTNALTGLANAAWDGGPMLLISGSSPTATMGLDQFQELDQVAMADPVCKYAKLVSRIETLEHETNAALAAAVTGRPGPVHLTIPGDVLSAPMDEQRAKQRDRSPIQVVCRAPGDRDLVKDAVALLAKAKRPFLVVGSGVFYANAARELAQFAGLTDIPIVSHIWDRCCVEQTLPQYVGVTNAELNRSMEMAARADVVMLLGARADYRVGYGRPNAIAKNAKLIRVDIDPAEINRAALPEIGIQGDPRSVLVQMIREAKRVGRWSNGGWLAQVRRKHEQLVKKWARLGSQNVCPVPGIRICRELKKFLDRDVTFLLDGGNIGRWVHMTLFDRHPSHWMTCGASGVVGWGLPGAVAAKMARPDHPLLLLSGDGSAGFTLAEIETALRFSTPYVAVVAHDSAWGIVADGQQDDRRVGSEFGEIRFDRVAEALGAKGVYVSDPRELSPAIERGLAEDTVTVIHVPTQLAGVGVWEQRFGLEG